MNRTERIFLIILLTLASWMVLSSGSWAGPISGCGECTNTYICPDSITCKTTDCGITYHVFRGEPSRDGPNLILTNRESGKKKTVVITANTRFFPGSMTVEKLATIPELYVVYVKEYKNGISQAIEVFDARHASVYTTWCPSEHRYRKVVKSVAAHY